MVKMRALGLEERVELAIRIASAVREREAAPNGKADYGTYSAKVRAANAEYATRRAARLATAAEDAAAKADRLAAREKAAMAYLEDLRANRYSS